MEPEGRGDTVVAGVSWGRVSRCETDQGWTEQKRASEAEASDTKRVVATRVDFRAVADDTAHSPARAGGRG
jgi:hypothetical protein